MLRTDDDREDYNMICQEFLSGGRFQAALVDFKAGHLDTLCITPGHSFDQVCALLSLACLLWVLDTIRQTSKVWPGLSRKQHMRCTA